jgi:hypothetical protein
VTSAQSATAAGYPGVAAWQRGCVAAWQRGCVAAWQRGSVAAWQRGSVAAWLHLAIRSQPAHVHLGSSTVPGALA